MIDKIHHVGILVKDVDRSLKFYTDVLGLAVRERRTLPNGTEVVYLPAGGTEIELVARPQPPDEEQLNHIAFTVHDIEETVRNLGEAGLSVPSDIRFDSEGRATVFVPGPNGFTLELIQEPRERVL